MPSYWFIFLSLITGLGIPGVAAEAPKEMNVLLEQIAAKHQVPGMAVVVLRGDKIIAQGVAGVRKAGSPERITINDKFHLGSDTKAMTATLLGMLVEEGTVKWSSTLGELFGDGPSFRPEWKDVTLQQVLAHRAGLAANAGPALRARVLSGNKSLREQRRMAIAAVLANPPEHPPGTKYLYSNLDYILIGAVIEKITGCVWEDAIRERLFSPLEITSGGFGAPSASGRLDQPWGHLPNGSPAPAMADNPPYTGPAATAHMTITDWAKFIALHLRGDPSNPNAGPLLLKPETFAALHTPATGESYTGGWILGTRPLAKGPRSTDTGKILSHAGSNTMWFCTTWLAPEIDFAVLVTANHGPEHAAKACDEVVVAMFKEFSRPGP